MKDQKLTEILDSLNNTVKMPKILVTPTTWIEDNVRTISINRLSPVYPRDSMSVDPEYKKYRKWLKSIVYDNKNPKALMGVCKKERAEISKMMVELDKGGLTLAVPFERRGIGLVMREVLEDMVINGVQL